MVPRYDLVLVTALELPSKYQSTENARNRVAWLAAPYSNTVFGIYVSAYSIF